MAASERPDSVNECSICTDTLRNPKLLSCCHSFCELCLKLWIEKQDKQLLGIECPLCRNVTKPSDRNVKRNEWVAMLPDAEVCSTDLAHKWCDPCRSTGEERNARYFCVECNENMCVDCQKAHRKLKICRAHVTVEITKESRRNIPMHMEYNKLLKCNAHTDKNIEFCCKSHDEIFCSTCAFLHHRSCADVLEIESNRGKIPAGKALPLTSKLLQNLAKYIQDAIDVHENYEAEVENDEASMKGKSKEMRNNLNRKFEKYQVQIQEQLKKKNENCKVSNHESLDKLSAVREKLDLIVKTTKLIGTRLKKSSPSYIIVTRQLDQKYMQCFDEISSLRQDTFNSFVFQPNNEFLGMLDKSGVIGSVVEKSSSVKLPQMPHKQNQQSKTISEYDNKYSFPKSKKAPYYTSVAIMSDQRFVLADQNNKRLLICIDEKDVRVIRTGRYQPYMIFCTEKTMFVSVPSERKIKTYDVQNDFKEGHGIKTRGECYVLAYVEHLDIIMSSLHDGERWELVTYDAAGKEIESIDNADGRQFQSIWHLLILGDTIYQPSQEDNQVYAFKLTNRRPVFMYKDPKLDCPGGIHGDFENNVYICGINSKNIHIITNQGIPIKIVQLQDSVYPTFIYLSDNGEDLVVLGKADNPGPFFFQLQ